MRYWNWVVLETLKKARLVKGKMKFGGVCGASAQVAVVWPADVGGAVPLEPELQPAAIKPAARTTTRATFRKDPLNVFSDFIRHPLRSGSWGTSFVHQEFSCL